MNSKIYNIELYENKKSKGIMTIEEKNSTYQIDMYVRKDISYKMSLKFVERIKSIFDSFIYIAFGDDFLIGEGNQIQDIISSSSGVELWVFPLDSHEEIIRKLKQ